MTESLIIYIPGGTLTILPEFVPVPAADLRKLLKYTEMVDIDGAAVLLEFCEQQKETCRKGTARFRYIERNEEVIKRWQNQKKRKSLTSPTE